MVEELLLSGADIIKVGIGPGKMSLCVWKCGRGVGEVGVVWYGGGEGHIAFCYRVSVHNTQEDRSGVPPTECSIGVCRCCTWSWRTHCICEESTCICFCDTVWLNCCYFQDGGCTCPGDVAKAFGLSQYTLSETPQLFIVPISFPPLPNRCRCRLCDDWWNVCWPRSVRRGDH